MRGGTGEETEWPVKINWGPGINYIYRLDIFFKISKMPPHFSSYFRKTPPSRFCPHHPVSSAELRTKMGFLTQTYTLRDRIKSTTLLAR